VRQPPARPAVSVRRSRPTALLEQGLAPVQVAALRLLVEQAPELGLGRPSADTLVLLRLVVLSYNPDPDPDPDPVRRLRSVVDGDARD
jgi:hypothetical protein